MTKEDIIFDLERESDGWQGLWAYDQVEKAMDEYAKQESIDFGKFISANGWQQYDEADRWICPSNNNDVITTKQLYERYDAQRT